MQTTSLFRPVGFTPEEISPRVNERVVSQHAEEAAFLWTIRTRAVTEPHYTLRDMVTLDERVEAHLDGLRIGGGVAWRDCIANAEHQSGGETFAVAVLAFGAGNLEHMGQALANGSRSPADIRGLVSALGWLEYGTIATWLGRLLQARSPLHRRIAIRAMAIHRQDPGSALDQAVGDPDSGLRAAAIRTIGELKRRDLLQRVRTSLNDSDEACRFWAAWTLAIHRERDGVDSLMSWCHRDDDVGRRALQMVLRALSPDEARSWIRTFVKDSALVRPAVFAIGVFGDPSTVPWLIRRMEEPDAARLAGEAFTMITGIDLSSQKMNEETVFAATDSNPSLEEVLALDYESNLTLPSSTKVSAWWEKNGNRFADGMRYLAGQPITRDALINVLATGKQRQRASAALELALLEFERNLFEFRARGSEQRKRLSSWTS